MPVAGNFAATPGLKSPAASTSTSAASSDWQQRFLCCAETRPLGALDGSRAEPELWAESASSEPATSSANSATAAVRRVRPCRWSIQATDTAVSAQKYGLQEPLCRG